MAGGASGEDAEERLLLLREKKVCHIIVQSAERVSMYPEVKKGDNSLHSLGATISPVRNVTPLCMSRDSVLITRRKRNDLLFLSERGPDRILLGPVAQDRHLCGDLSRVPQEGNRGSEAKEGGDSLTTSEKKKSSKKNETDLVDKIVAAVVAEVLLEAVFGKKPKKKSKEKPIYPEQIPEDPLPDHEPDEYWSG